MSGTRLLKNMSIQNKVLILLGVATAGLLLVWGTSFVSSKIIDTYQAKVERNGKLRTVISNVQIGFLQERRSEKDFLIRLSEKYIGRHAATAEEIDADLDKALEIAVGDEIEKIKLIKETFHEYTDQFVLVANMWKALGLDNESGLRNTLRAAVHEVEELLKQNEAVELTAAMLMLRRREKDFIIRVDEEYIGKHAKDMETFISLVDKSSLPGGDKGKVKNLAASYAKAFNEFAALRLQEVSEVSILSDKYAVAEPILEELITNVAANVTAAEEAENSIESQAQIIGLIFVVVIFAVVLLLALVVGRTISGPISALRGQMNQISEGDNVEILNREGSDEISAMANTLAIFQNKMNEATRLQEESTRRQQVEVERGRKIDDLAKEFDEKITHVLEIVSAASTQLDASAQTMSGIATGSSERATAAASASEEATTNVQTVSAACEELSASIKEISRQSVQSNGLAKQATADVERTENVVKELSESANRINEIVSIISDIAEQTNLLALNATIEAARAGEAGKGFAVVANEVKSLANQTARATSEIGETIAVVLDKVSESVEAINSVTGRIAEIAEMIASISSSVDEQNSATAEISRNVEEAANGTAEVNRNVGEVSAMAEEAGQASNEVQRAASELASQSSEMKKVVDSFLSGVRAV